MITGLTDDDDILWKLGDKRADEPLEVVLVFLEHLQ